MKKKNLILIIGVAILILGLSFFSGVKYAQMSFSPPGFQNLSQEERQKMRMQSGGPRQNRGDNMVIGEIISKDQTSMTLKTRGGGSRIVFFSDSTKINKAVEGGKDDVTVGSVIVVNGKGNPDGSVTAERIQIGQF